MKKFLSFLVLSVCVSMSFKVAAQISGTVYRDYNGNGVKGGTVPNLEPGVLGIVVNAYNSTEQLIASFVSNASGVYSIPSSGSAYNGTQGSNTGFIASGTQVRLEFVIPTTNSCGSTTFDYSSFIGSGTSVRFITAGAGATNVNYGINSPEDYSTSTNPTVFVPKFIQGNPTGGGNAGTESWFLGFPYNNTGTTTPTQTVNGVNLGSVWGVAYSRQAQKIFTSAFIKRHVGLGTLGSGGIYLLTPTATSFTVSSFYDMDANGHRTRAASGTYGSGNSFNYSGNTAITFLGATDALTGQPNGLGVIGTNVERGLATNVTTTSYDPAAFDQIGKVGLGDIEISADGKYLFVMNLYSRLLFRLTLNDAYNPTSVTSVDSYSLPNETVTNGVMRPFGLKFYQNKVYVGAVASGENAGSNTLGGSTNMFGYVFELQNAIGAASFNSTPLLKIPLNYNKGLPWDLVAASNRWYPWSNITTNFFNVSGGTNSTYPTPMLSNIDFADNGGMILSFTDRSGHQYGHQNRKDLRTNTTLIDIFIGGDLLFAGKNCATGAYSLEVNGTLTTQGNTITSTAPGPGNNEGPATINGTVTGYTGTHGEFFRADDVIGAGNTTTINHEETIQGAVAVLKGDDKVLTTFMDPVNLNGGGLMKHSTSTGVATGGYELYISSGSAIDAFFRKGNGLGDIELLTTEAPLEIGNRIWNDANGDGIQNANELGIAGVTLELFLDANNDGVPDAGAVGTVTTDASGNYFFSSATGTDVTGIDYGISIAQNSGYIIRVASSDWASGVGAGDLLGYQLTKTDKLGNGAADLSDNDASLTSNIPQIRLTTGSAGQNNHNLDFGFKSLASLGDKVWRDDDTDGIQDAGEPGVAGVTVALYQNGSDGTPGTTDDVFIGTTVTDAYGIYLFDNLAASTNPATSYNVGFTLPANYQFTTQTNTQVTGTSDATNTTTLSGGSTAANGSDANVTTGRTASFWLAPGEAERGVDAGIIFNQPSVNSISDRVWLDSDNDGTQDTNEGGVSGVTVTLYASDGVTVIATTITDASGNYRFNNLPDGNYRVGFTQPTGLIFTSKGGDNTSGGGGDSVTDSDVNTTGVNFGKTDLINLDASSSISTGVNYTNVDAGLITQPAATCSLGDKVWNDLDNDGVQDAGEPGVAGVTITLYAGDGTTVITTTVTDAFGNYIFNNLSAGNYVIGFGTGAGFIRSTNQFTGTSYYDDNNANPTTGKTLVLTLVAGTRDLSIDAALVSTSPNTARVGDRVWFDADKNGIQDAGEVGIGGVTVTLYNSSNVAIGTTATDANGNYQFTNLAAGNYSVGFSNFPDGYSLTTTTGTTTATATTNSDANTATGRTTQFALAAGESLQGLDAGLVTGVASGLGSLGNRIWYDLDGDGVQDVGELGVTAMVVTLLDAGADGILGNGDDGVSRTTTTNALGEYIFTGLAAGNYAVQFGTNTTQLPSGYTTNPNQGANDAVDSDGNAIAGGISTTGVYSLATGEDNLTVDLGIIPPATTNSLGNFVWFDQDSDGVQDSGEPGVAGVMVTLYNNAGSPISYTTTNANGEYLFAGLTDGTYSVGFSNLPAGFDLTTKETTNTISGGSDADIATGRTVTVALNSGNRNDRTLDGGIVSTRAALGNFVWSDTDGDGVQDAGEPGVPGVTVTLYRPGFGLDDIAGNGDDNLPVASMITDQNGAYLFSNLVAGTYQVEFSTIPSGLSFTQQNTPGDNQDNTNSDAVPVVGNPTVARTGNIVLSAGEVDLTIDAGLFKPRAIIGNYVWADVDSDGIQDAGETGAAGVTVSLLDNFGNIVAVAVTDGAGFYQFPNVAPGTYSLSFSNLPNGTSFTTANQTAGGGNDNNDSDVIGTTITGIVVLPTTTNLSFDAGIINFRTLPISKLVATATLAGEVATINWLTENEVNTSHFILERSVDGINFTEVGNLNAGGNVNGEAKYTLPNSVSGLSNKVYYRIKLIEADGKIRYSNIATVNIIVGSNVKVWPNPFVDQISISLKVERNTQITVSIVDVIGRTNAQRSYTLVKGTNQLSINNLGSFPAGTYAVKVTAENGELLQTIKLVK